MNKQDLLSLSFADFSPFARASLDLLDAGVIFVDSEFKILFMNKTKRDRYPEVVPGESWVDAIPFSDERIALVRRAMETGETQENQCCLVADAFGIRHLDVRVSPVRDEEGRIVGAVEVAFDVEDLFQSHQQMERLNKEYESVIYALSHDLRAPLVSIEGFLRKLQKRCIDPNDEVATHCLDRIHANVRMMNDFVNVLLDTSRISKGKLDLQVVSFSELVQSVAHQFEHQASEQGATIEMTGEFPNVLCDRIRTLQVFNNLVSNSLLHGRNAQDLRIEIGCKGDVLWVKDNGPGIQKDFQERVFEPFTQGERNGDNHFGMGLNIVHKIVQKHGGRIWIDSSPGKGTAIYFTFLPQT